MIDCMRMLNNKALVQIARGAVLHLVLDLECLEISDPENTMRWTGTQSIASFLVHAPAQLMVGGHIGTVKVFVKGSQVAGIKFTVGVGKEYPATIL